MQSREIFYFWTIWRAIGQCTLTRLLHKLCSWYETDLITVLLLQNKQWASLCTSQLNPLRSLAKSVPRGKGIWSKTFPQGVEFSMSFGRESCQIPHHGGFIWLMHYLLLITSLLMTISSCNSELGWVWTCIAFFTGWELSLCISIYSEGLQLMFRVLVLEWNWLCPLRILHEYFMKGISTSLETTRMGKCNFRLHGSAARQAPSLKLGSVCFYCFYL